MKRLIIPSHANGFARYAAESESPSLWKGLVGAWLPFLGPTGATLRDWSGHQNHGTLTNMDPATDWVTAPDKVGRSTYVLDLDGINDYISIADDPIFDFTTGAFSVCVWFNAANLNTTANERLVSKGITGSAEGWEFAILASTDGLWFGDSAGLVYTSTDITDGNFYHACGVYDGSGGFSGLKIYVDGVSQSLAEAGTFTGVQVTNEPLAIGCLISGGTPQHYFDGLIAQVRIYNRALSAKEIIEQHENPYAMWRRKRRSIGYVAAVGAVAPTGVFYGPLVGPLSGPV